MCVQTLVCLALTGAYTGRGSNAVVIRQLQNYQCANSATSTHYVPYLDFSHLFTGSSSEQMIYIKILINVNYKFGTQMVTDLPKPCITILAPLHESLTKQIASNGFQKAGLND